jgi:hypothetical protein
MRGVPARAIQAAAGHVSISTTERYMHLSPAAEEGAIRLLDAARDVARSRLRWEGVAKGVEAPANSSLRRHLKALASGCELHPSGGTP